MKLRLAPALLLALVLVAVGGESAAARADPAPPTISTYFAAQAAAPQGKVGVLYSIVDPAAGGPLTAVAFTDTLPPGLPIYDPPDISSNCGGTVTAVPGTHTISLTGGTLAAGASCGIGVDLRPTGTGTQTNATGPVSATESGPGAPSGSTQLDILLLPTLGASVDTSSVGVGASLTLSIAVGDPNPAYPLLDVGTIATLPAGLVVADPSQLAGSCGSDAALRAVPGAATVQLLAGSVPAGGRCSFSVRLRAVSAGSWGVDVGEVTASFDAGGGDPSAIRSASAVVPVTIVGGAAQPSTPGPDTASFGGPGAMATPAPPARPIVLRRVSVATRARVQRGRVLVTVSCPRSVDGAPCDSRPVLTLRLRRQARRVRVACPEVRLRAGSHRVIACRLPTVLHALQRAGVVTVVRSGP